MSLEYGHLIDRNIFMAPKYESISQEILLKDPELIKNVLIPNILMCGRPDGSGYRSLSDTPVSDIRFGDDLTVRIMNISPHNTNIAIMDNRTHGIQKHFVSIRIDENDSVTIYGDHVEDVLGRIGKDLFDSEYQPVTAYPALKLMALKDFGSGLLLEKKVIRGIVSNPNQFKSILKSTPDGKKMLRTPLGEYYQQLEWLDTAVEADFFHGYFSEISSQFKKDRMEWGYNDTLGFMVGSVVRDIQLGKISTDQLNEFQNHDFRPASSMINDKYPVSLRQLGYLLSVQQYEPIADMFVQNRDGDIANSYYEMKSILEIACFQVKSEPLNKLLEIISTQAVKVNIEAKTRKRLDIVLDTLKESVKTFSVNSTDLDIDSDKLIRALRKDARLDVHLSQLKQGRIEGLEKESVRKLVYELLRVFLIDKNNPLIESSYLNIEENGNRIGGHVKLKSGLSVDYFYAPDKQLEKVTIAYGDQTIVFKEEGRDIVTCDFSLPHLFEIHEASVVLGKIRELPLHYIDRDIIKLMNTHKSLRQQTTLGLLYKKVTQSLR